MQDPRLLLLELLVADSTHVPQPFKLGDQQNRIGRRPPSHLICGHRKADTGLCVAMRWTITTDSPPRYRPASRRRHDSRAGTREGRPRKCGRADPAEACSGSGRAGTARSEFRAALMRQDPGMNESSAGAGTAPRDALQPPPRPPGRACRTGVMRSGCGWYSTTSRAGRRAAFGRRSAPAGRL